MRTPSCWRPIQWSASAGGTCPRPTERRGAPLPDAYCPGRRHLVMTAVVLRGHPDGSRRAAGGDRRGFLRLTAGQITATSTLEGEGKAGGYAIQGQPPRLCAVPVRQLFRRRRSAAVRDGAAAAGPRLGCLDRTILAGAGQARSRSRSRSEDAWWITRCGGPVRRTDVGDVHRGRVGARVPAWRRVRLRWGRRTVFCRQRDATSRAGAGTW